MHLRTHFLSWLNIETKNLPRISSLSSVSLNVGDRGSHQTQSHQSRIRSAFIFWLCHAVWPPKYLTLAPSPINLPVVTKFTVTMNRGQTCGMCLAICLGKKYTWVCSVMLCSEAKKQQPGKHDQYSFQRLKLVWGNNYHDTHFSTEAEMGHHLGKNWWENWEVNESSDRLKFWCFSKMCRFFKLVSALKLAHSISQVWWSFTDLCHCDITKPQDTTPMAYLKIRNRLVFNQTCCSQYSS